MALTPEQQEAVDAALKDRQQRLKREKAQRQQGNRNLDDDDYRIKHGITPKGIYPDD